MTPKRDRNTKKQNNNTSAEPPPIPPGTAAPAPPASNQKVKNELMFAMMARAMYATERSSAPTQIIKTKRRDSDPSETDDQRMNRSCAKIGGSVNPGSGTVSGSESQSQSSMGLTKRQIPAELPHVEGYFMPPAGWNPDPPPVFDQSAMWSHLPPPYRPGVDIHEGDPATAPRKIITSIEGIHPNTMRDTPSPPNEAQV